MRGNLHELQNNIELIYEEVQNYQRPSCQHTSQLQITTHYKSSE